MENIIIHDTETDKRYKLIIEFENIDGTEPTPEERDKLLTAVLLKLQPVWNKMNFSNISIDELYEESTKPISW